MSFCIFFNNKERQKERKNKEINPKRRVAYVADVNVWCQTDLHYWSHNSSNACLYFIQSSRLWNFPWKLKDDYTKKKIAKFAQILGIPNNAFKLTLAQKFPRIKVCNALALPIISYGSEIWTLRKKRIKNDWHQRRLIFFFQNSRLHTFWPPKEWRNFGRVENRTSWWETKTIQIELVTTCNKMNNYRMPKIILNYRPNGRKRLGRPWKRL